MRGRRTLCAAMVALCALMATGADAESIKIGLTKLASGGPVYIAIDKGYFAAEGIDAQTVFFAASYPIAVATVSGDIDFGSAGLTAALYQLGGQGALKIIGANALDTTGFPQYGFIVSNKAYDGGLKSYKDLTGKSIGLGEIGAPAHYTLSLVTAKFGVDLKTIRVLPMQAIVNVVSAVSGSQIDGGITPASAVTAGLQHGDFKLLGYPGEEAPTQGGAVIITAKTANERGDLAQRYLRALRKGDKDYYDAFVGPDGKPRQSATAPEILNIIAKYTGQPIDQIVSALPYFDPEGRLDVKDVLHQIDWYRSQGMIKGEFDDKSVIDMRYVVPLPE
jgi:NitT/TauT family transport system substrate-binding protein